MGNGATKREILEKKLEKRLQDPKTEPLISLPLDFLEDITCGFSTEREVGTGGYGVVYKGVLRSGKTIAVKKIFDKHLLDNDNQVENEIVCLTEVRHQNVIQLVGYCLETKSEVMEYNGKHVVAQRRACLLCFEFLCNGNLDEHLSDDTLGLDWDIRYEIIRGICRGLQYLHDECHIVHLDLKPQNILMDSTMMPKIADFGLSRLLGEQKSKTVTKNLAGTIGYMAKEYIDKGIISSKADIFSLGVIIIEIITGRRDYPNINETSNDISNRTETSLKRFTEEVVGCWRKRLEITLMHMSLEIHIQQVEQCISIALKCLEPDSNKRPTSLDIVQSLNAEEPKYSSLGKTPIVAKKDRRQNKYLQSRVNMNIINIPKAIGVTNGLNECANLFQWVTSAISSLKSQSNETQKERLQGDVQQLHSDLQCLADILPPVYNLIDRAEWRVHDHYVADLLSRLKDAVYDAEDLLDEFRWYEQKVSVEGNAISVEPVIDFFQYVTQGRFNKVTDIQKRLNNLSGQLEKMGLFQAIPRFDKSFRPETTSFPIDENIFGRDKEKGKLIRMLGVPTDNSTGPSGRKRTRSGVCSSASNQICAAIGGNEATIRVPVLPIVGIGGVGKTTLAQDICNHSKVKLHFHPIIWICVSHDFDVKRLTKEALDQSSSPDKVPKTDNLNRLQRALADIMKDKRFLIVLDDMWDENVQVWKHFCAPFRNVLQGSMMLVTTRSMKVADIVRTMDPFCLEGLIEDVIRKFFKICIFGSDYSDNDPELERIGEEILPKLKGSPLAAKTLGRLLGMSLDVAHWDRILKSQLWELRQEGTDILPALRLSYMYLPFYLKRCFSLCAVYPKDYTFRKEELAEIWVAEGLVQHQPNIPLQHTCGQYFEELAHLSFFQKHPRDNDKYVIHDLIHDMAQLISKDECFIIKDVKDFPKIPQNVRHLSVLKGGDVNCSDLLNLCKHRKLRTLLCYMYCNPVMEKWCTELLCMRVMVCSSMSLWGLPGSISNMKHLRYLEILGSCFCKTLPKAFFCLYNLKIFYANMWEIDYIPSGFGKLINLKKFESKTCQFRHVHSVGILNGATDKGRRSQLKLENYNGESLPSWFHPQNSQQIRSYDSINSTFLSLTDVIIHSCKNLSNLEQFVQPAYVPLIKKIEISKCRTLESVPTERFRDLCFLEELSVSQCPKIKSRHLFAPSLKKLFLENSGNLVYNIECSSLTFLHFSDSYLESIKLQMWNLPLLQELKISSCPSLTVIRDSEPISFEDFPFLEVLSVSYCPNVKSRYLFAPSLKKLYLTNSGNLGYNIECSSLTILHLRDCPFESIELQMLNLPLLQELKITVCSSLTIIRDLEPISTDLSHGRARSRMGKFLKLTHLIIKHCEKLEIMDNLLYLPAIESITISVCGLLSLPANRLGEFPCLKDLNISFCRSVNWQSGVLLPSCLQKLTLWSCGDFSAWFPSCLENCTTLKSLEIAYCECVLSIAGHLWSSNLKSLQSLKFLYCSELKSIGGPDAISHISDLYIDGCLELKEFDQPLRKGSFC